MAAETTIDSLAGAVAPVDGIMPVVINKQKTLVEQLHKLDHFLQSAREYNLQRSLDEIIDRRTGILRDFFQENPLAGEVFRKESSYAQLIKPIMEKDSGFWNRFMGPKYDTQLDRNAQEVISSMENVGIYSLEPEEFLTKGRRETFYKKIGVAAMVFGATGAGISLSVFSSLNLALVGGYTIAGSTMVSLLNYITDNKHILQEELTQAAKQTDDYLAKIQLINKEWL